MSRRRRRRPAAGRLDDLDELELEAAGPAGDGGGDGEGDGGPGPADGDQIPTGASAAPAGDGAGSAEDATAGSAEDATGGHDGHRSRERADRDGDGVARHEDGPGPTEGALGADGGAGAVLAPPAGGPGTEADEAEVPPARAPRARRAGPLRRLYRGETSFDFVGRRRWWFVISAVVILAGVVSLGVRGLNLGITFKGGDAWVVKAPGVTQVQAVDVVQAAGLTEPTVQLLGSGGAQQVRVTADLNSLSVSARKAQSTKVVRALAKMADVSATTVATTTVGPTWGGQVTKKAVIALIVFLVLVALYISVRFEPKMALAAFVALLHDLLVTAGVYSLFGFQVTPDTVIAVLTILGYSLYDTVVVFDRVRDNSRGVGASGRMTYSDMVNLSMNQTLARSINTSLVAILPVLAVLLIGAQLLGATTLQNYGLALFVGLLSGAYSSIFIASPVLAIFKEREPRYAAVRQKLASRGDRLGRLTPSAAAALAGGAAGGSAGRTGRSARPDVLRPGQAAQRAAAGRGRTATVEGPPEVAVGSAVPAGNATASGVGAARPAPARRAPQRPRKGSKGGSKGGKRRR